MTLLTRVEELLASRSSQVEAPGYTDAQPTDTVQFPSNWPL
ncbi:MAG: hypothetical protein ACP5QO_09330 [Clostridia bacterium]